MENWKQIPFEPEYEVSDSGRVRKIETQHIKSLRKNRGGYARVTLYPSGKTYQIHQLVMQVFTTTRDAQINHVNGDKLDNTLNNLEWCSASHNSRHRDTVLRSKWNGQLNPGSKLTAEEAKLIKYSHNDLSNQAVAALYNTTDENVRRIRKGDRWPHI